MLFLNKDFTFAQKNLDKKADKLKAIQEQIEEKREELEKYINREEELKRKLKVLKEDEKKTSSLKNSLENNILNTQKEIINIKTKYDTLKSLYNDMLIELKNEALSLYLRKFSFSDYYNTSTIIEGLIIRNMIVKKYNFAKTINITTQKTEKDIKLLSMKKQEIMKEKEQVEKKLKQNKLALNSTSFQIRENKKKYKELEEEIEDLKRSAIELTKLLRKLEKQSPYKKNKYLDIGLQKKSLPWPVEGKIIGKFGKEYISELKTWIVREGIKIKSTEDAKVYPVYNGKVIFTGPFRNYGNVVILSHDTGFYSIYGFLSKINVNNGDLINVNTPLGVVGDDSQSLKGGEKFVLYFEIRVGEDAVDPLIWLK